MFVLDIAMLTEKEIVNKLNEWLLINDYNIIQLIYPGGQATYSIKIEDQDKKYNIIYPDLITIKDSKIIIGEVKPLFSIEDYNKLLKLHKSSSSKITIINLIKRIINSEKTDFEIIFWLIHSSTLNRQYSKYPFNQLILENGKFNIY